MGVRRREAMVFGLLAVALVLIRAAAFTLSERISFNSDQAIVGLMAKHLSELQSFPFFYYGQSYMLGVQAWIIAPFFAIARPSVTVLRIPLVILNVLAAVLLVRGMTTQSRLRPALAFVAALPFIVPTPIVAGSFLESLGSSGVEPLLYMLVLWWLRTRPIAFGALLAFGFLHREFTLYAIPALAVVQIADRPLWTATIRWAVRVAAGFSLVWVALDDLRWHLEGASILQQAEMASGFACLQITSLGSRIGLTFDTLVLVLSGGSRIPLYESGLHSSAVAGSRLIGWVVVGALGVMLARIAWCWKRRPADADIRFGAYLALIGVCALAVHSLGCGRLGTGPVLRYVNLALLLPIGCFAVFMAIERSDRLRLMAVAVFSLWAAANLADNVRVIHAAYVDPQPAPHRVLADFLVDNQIRYARADYWDAYIVDFLSRERVIVGSFGPVRIPDYERRVDENADTAVRVVRMPCDGWRQVAAWCIQLPARQSEPGPR